VRFVNGPIVMWGGQCPELRPQEVIVDNSKRSADRNSAPGKSATPSHRGFEGPTLSDYGLQLVCIHSLDGKLLSVSSAGAKALGYEPEEMMGRAMQDFLPLDVRNQLPAYLSHIAQHGTASGFMRVLTKSGEERILAYSNRLRQAPDKPAHVLGHAADVTEIKKAEKQLREAEQRFRFLIECTSEVVTVADAEGTIKYVSPAVRDLLGYSAKQVVGHRVFDYLEPSDLPLARTRFAVALQKPGEEIPIEVRLRKLDGEYIALKLMATNLIGTPGVEGLVIAARDPRHRNRVADRREQQEREFEQRDRRREVELAATNRILVAEIREREQTERALRRSQSLLQATLESTADGILVVDREGKFVSYNRQFTAMWDIPQDVLERGSDEEALQLVLGRLKHPDEFLAKVQALYKNPEQASYDVLDFKDGRVFERYSQPQQISGNIVGRVWSFRDVTERKRLEDYLRQAQKMEAVGRLAGGVAHDFNNLLMVIMGHCNELSSEGSQAPQAARRSIDQIMAASVRAAALTRQLLAFSRRQVLSPRVFDANLALAELSIMLRRLISEDIELQITPSESAAFIEADAAQLDQVIVNLVVNARDAMPKGGTLTVNARCLDLQDIRTRGTASVPPGKYVVLTVADTGIGIKDEMLPHIFEPFFTTKELGQGTGLGLSTAYGIVRQSHGQILVESDWGRGTRFEIYLPRLEAPAASTAIANVPVEAARGSETILLVEDENGIRALTKTFLEQQGYTVLAATNGREALALAEGYSELIHLLVTDVIMPGMRGTELAAHLRSHRPDMQVLYVSGYPEEEISDPDAAFLQKPFPMEELGFKIRLLLDKDQASAA
jgi:PAS domain S-box-containing protein